MPPESEIPSLEEVQDKVIRALDELYEQDHVLIELDANERSITHKLGCYLQNQFPDWNVDCEYNRKGKAPKEIRDNIGVVQSDDTDAHTIFPDIIVHYRNLKQNLLIIEAKKNSRRIDLNDKDKIEYLIGSEEFRYSFGLWINISKRRKDIIQKWFRNVDGRCEEVENIE